MRRPLVADVSNAFSTTAGGGTSGTLLCCMSRTMSRGAPSRAVTAPVGRLRPDKASADWTAWSTSHSRPAPIAVDQAS